METIAFLSSLGLLAVFFTLFAIDRRARQQAAADPQLDQAPADQGN